MVMFYAVEIVVHVYVLVEKIEIWDLIGILSFEIGIRAMGFGI